MSESETKTNLDDLLSETKSVRAELEKINAHNLIRTYDSLPSLLFFMFLKGIAFGLGSVVGATIVVSVLVYILGQVQMMPIIGEWIRALLEIIQSEQI
ncbi:MAG: DUF5665 domain-containing protein [Pseudomonadota bacterium]